MGNCLPPLPSAKGLVISVEQDVDASFETMWDTFVDVPNQPSFLSNVEKIELLTKKGGKQKVIPQSKFEYKEGALWRETSNFFGEVNVGIESITCLREVRDDQTGDVLSRSVGIHSQLEGFVHYDSNHTATYSIHKNCQARNRCTIHVTAAFLPVGCWGVLDLWRRGREVRTWAQGTLERLISEYVTEAEGRHKTNNTKMMTAG